jgi:ABC-type lipoprotein export system ATPase subunit
MLEFKEISKTFTGPNGRIKALRKVTFSISPGEILAISGPSGCGKTTLLLTAAGLLQPEQGKVILNGQNLYELNSEKISEIRARSIGFVFQQFHLIPYLTVQQNIMAPALALPSENLTARTSELISLFGLENRSDFIPTQLSTGERQRTALARALLFQPKIIMADEPTGNLDNYNSEIVFNHFSRYIEKGGCVLLVTHDNQAASHATRSLMMQDGEISNRLKT